MMDPVVLYYGKGQLTGFLADPDGILDVVSMYCPMHVHAPVPTVQEDDHGC